MDRLEVRNRCEIQEVTASPAFQAFLDSGASGIRLIAEPFAEDGRRVIKPDAGDFAKWVKSNSDLHVDVEHADRLVLHSSEVWLPLVFLATDVGLPLYLNLVANYLYERFRGALRGERPRVHLAAEYVDESSGTYKKFEFEGDDEALRVAIERFDLNNFMNG